MLLAGIQRSAEAQNYIFAQLTGSPVNTSGWNLQGAATVKNIINTNNSEILLCDRTNNKSGAIFFNQPINLSICSKWKAEFDFRMFDGTGADGIAFCFLDVPPVGFVTGSGLGIPAAANGLKVCFDTWNNCDPNNYHKDMPKVELRWGAGYNECNTGMPELFNTNGGLDSIRSYNYNHAKIEYDKGAITVSVNGKVLLTGNQQFTFSGYLGFTASTGGFNDNHSIKNVVIYTEMPPSVANSSGVAPAFCPNTSTQLGTTTTTGYTYTWSPTEGLSNATIADPILLADNMTDSIRAIKYYVQTAFASNPGCYSKDSVTVTVYPRPKVAFATPAICLNDATAQFTDSTSSKDAGSYPFQYVWTFDDAANATTANPNTSVLQNPGHKYSRAANYNVQLAARSAHGCSDSLMKIFTVNGSVPKAQFVMPAATVLCSNDSIFITDNSTVDFGSVTKIEIYWDLINAPGTKFTDDKPYAGKRYANQYNRFAQPGSKQFQVRYIAYSGITCLQTFDTTITLLASPEILFDTIPAVCNNTLPFQITQASLVQDMSGAFSYSGTGVTPSGTFYPAIIGAGTFVVRATFNADNGCKDSASRSITVWPAPLVDAGPNIFILEGSSVQMQATVIGSPSTYVWSPAIYLDSITSLTPKLTPHADTMYYLTATDLHTCSNTDSVFVKVLFAPQVPNAFSPNGDNINDTWVIKYLGDYPDCVLQVFSRSGQKVYQSQGYNKPWDGTLNGSPLPVATYYYLIQFKTGRPVVSGSVTILR